MAAKRRSYRPERGNYEVKEDRFVIGKTKEAAEYISTLGEQVKNNQQRNTDTIDHMVSLFRGSHDLGIPADKRYVDFDAKSAKAADVIFRILGMTIAPPKRQYIGPAGSAAQRDTRDRIEGHLNALDPFLWRKYGVRYDIQNRFWQLLAGKSYIQQTYLPFYWDKTTMRRKPNEEDGDYNARVEGYRGYMGPPVLRESLDPRIVFPVPNPLGAAKEYIKIYKVQRFEVDEAFKRRGKAIQWGKGNTVDAVLDLAKKPGLELPEQSDDDRTGSVTYYEYIDDVACYYVVGDKVIDRYMHKGGMRIFEARALQTGFKEHHLSSVGILWPVRNEIPQLDFARTLWLQKAYIDVNPQLFAILGAQEDPIRGDDQKPVEWDIEPGTVKQIRGQLQNALKDAASGVDFRAFIEMMAGDIDLATISGLARGIAGAQQPGYSINQLSQTMRIHWRPIIESASLQESQMDEHYLWMVKHIIRNRCTIFGERDSDDQGGRSGGYFDLDPDDIEDYFRIESIIEPELPIDKQGNMLTWTEMGMKGWATFEEVTREGFGKMNPVTRERQIWKDMGKRAMFPKATEDAMALGRVRLTNQILEAEGLNKLNSIFSLNAQALREGRERQDPPAGMEGAGDAAPPMQAMAGPQGGGGAMVPGSAGQSGPGITPTVGANPGNPFPASRQGSAL